MKILHVLAQLPEKTGSGVYFTNVINGLKKYDEVEQCCIYGTSKDYDINILDKNKQYEVIFESEKVPFPIVGMSDIMPYKNTLYSEMTEEMMDIWERAFREQLEKVKKEFNPDVIITHHLWILSSIVCEVFCNKKIVGICHNTDIRQAEKHKNIKNKYVKNLHKLDIIFSLSENQINDIIKVYNYDEKNIYNLGAGYNEKIFYPLEKYEKKDIVQLIYAGKFDESKGFFELIKAFELIEEKRKDVTLDLIGAIKEENKNKLEQYIKNVKNIKIYNVKNQKELADVMRTKDIFILPSYFEGLGLIAVEALGSGLRAVTTNIEGLIELLGKKINNSGVIQYVNMPTIYDTDKAVEEEKPNFIKRLAKAIEIQIDKTLEKREIEKEIFNEITKHSWKSKIENLYEILNK